MLVLVVTGRGCPVTAFVLIADACGERKAESRCHMPSPRRAVVERGWLGLR